MRLPFGTTLWPREYDREWEVLILALTLLLDPNLEDEERSQDREGADKLLCRKFFFAFPLAEVGRPVSTSWRCGVGWLSGRVSIARASSGRGMGSRMNSGRVSIA